MWAVMQVAPSQRLNPALHSPPMREYLDPEDFEYPEIHEDDGYSHDPDFDDVTDCGLRFLPLRRFIERHL